MLLPLGFASWSCWRLRAVMSWKITVAPRTSPPSSRRGKPLQLMCTASGDGVVPDVDLDVLGGLASQRANQRELIGRKGRALVGEEDAVAPAPLLGGRGERVGPHEPDRRRVEVDEPPPLVGDEHAVTEARQRIERPASLVEGCLGCGGVRVFRAASSPVDGTTAFLAILGWLQTSRAAKRRRRTRSCVASRPRLRPRSSARSSRSSMRRSAVRMAGRQSLRPRRCGRVDRARARARAGSAARLVRAALAFVASAVLVLQLLVFRYYHTPVDVQVVASALHAKHDVLGSSVARCPRTCSPSRSSARWNMRSSRSCIACSPGVRASNARAFAAVLAVAGLAAASGVPARRSTPEVRAVHALTALAARREPPVLVRGGAAAAACRAP